MLQCVFYTLLVDWPSRSGYTIGLGLKQNTRDSIANWHIGIPRPYFQISVLGYNWCQWLCQQLPFERFSYRSCIHTWAISRAPAWQVFNTTNGNPSLLHFSILCVRDNVHTYTRIYLISSYIVCFGINY